MEQFDIIGALETYALSKNWKFIYGVDEFYKSAASIGEYTPGKIVMIADFRANPTITNGRVTEIEYTCLVMLGRKFDDNSQAASLDETSKQKYDRRLKELMQLLSTALGQVACDNELELTVGDMVVNINQYAENIDFAASPNTIYVQ
jgi:hypothetical protein